MGRPDRHADARLDEMAAELPPTRWLPEPGDTFELSDGTLAVVEGLIGRGGEGSVHAVRRHDGRAGALKWYHDLKDYEARSAQLALLVDRGAPAPNFLWPVALAAPADASPDLAGFGYVMNLCPPQFRGLYDHVKRRVNASFRATVTVGIQLAEAFMRLHNEGLCYRDISFGNVLFDPATGQVMICDNDNVGVERASEALISGTPYFMAPEVMRRDVPPSRNSDLYSLAVLLFYVLMFGHPLTGRRELEYDHLDKSALARLLADDPLFVFDPSDVSNTPDPVEHAGVELYWSLYPARIKDKFRTAFTTGLQDPAEGRVLDGEWRLELARIRDLIVPCAVCGRSSILEIGGTGQRCWGARAHDALGEGSRCDAPLVRPPLLRFPRWTVAVTAETRLYPHHVRSDYDFSAPIASVVKHPTLDMWGLRNETNNAWTARTADGEDVSVPPGRSAAIVAGAGIDIVLARSAITCSIE